MKDPSSALDWWRDAEKELARAMKPYREIRPFMKKKHLTRSEAKKLLKVLERAAESMNKAAGSLGETAILVEMSMGK